MIHRLPALSPWTTGAIIAFLFSGFEWVPQSLRWPARILWTGLVLSLLVRAALAWRRNPPRPRQAAFAGGAIALGLFLAYVAAEVGAWCLIRLRPQFGSPRLELTPAQRRATEEALADRTPYTRLDPRLGWVNRPNAVSADGLARTNGDAIRADRSYSRSLGTVRERVLTFGDSYTHGNEVTNSQTWQHHAEQSRPGLEMLNFGVGGYGMTQALLRFETEIERFEATGAVLGCMTDDLRRSLNAYYPFRFRPPSLAPSASGSPYALVDPEDGLLRIMPNPLGSPEAYRSLLDHPAPALGRLARIEPLYPSPGRTPLLDLIAVSRQNHPAEWDRAARWFGNRARLVLLGKKPAPSQRAAPPNLYEPGHLVFETHLQLFERFHHTARGRGLTSLILWFPSPKDVAARAGGRNRTVYAAYLEALAARDIEAIDVLAWIEAEFGGPGSLDPSALFVGGHYSPPVNALIGRRLAERSWLPPEGGGGPMSAQADPD